MTTPQPGDRVRITYDAEYCHPDTDGYPTVTCFDQHHVYRLRIPRNATVELVQPRHTSTHDSSHLADAPTYDTPETAAAKFQQAANVMDAARRALTHEETR